MGTAEIISLVVTVFSVVVALWEINARLDIQKMLQQESLHLHSSVAIVLGNCQATIRNIKDNRIPDALSSAGNAEGGANMLLIQTGKIICHYHHPTDADIDNWISRGKIREDYRSLFVAHSEKNKGWLRSALCKIKEIIY
jgi:hypothetical protein